jgi:hypothetical protein
MDEWWSDVERLRPKFLEQNLSQGHFVLHKSHIDRLNFIPVLPISNLGLDSDYPN